MHPLTAAPHGVECQCVGKHVPLPIMLHNHHVVPQYYGGKTEDNNMVWICPNTHYNTHDLIRKYEHYKGKPPGHVRKHYSSYVQGLAQRAWDGRIVTKAQTENVITSRTLNENPDT